MEVYKHKSKVRTWSDKVDTDYAQEQGSGRVKEGRGLGEDETEEDSEHEGEGQEDTTSDLDYLRSKVVKDEDDPLPSKATPTTPHTLKMLGLPYRAKEKDIHTFFHPLKVVAVRFTQDPQGRPSGRAYADFVSESDLRAALKRNRDCILHRYIELFRDEVVESKSKEVVVEEKLKPWEVKGSAEEQESVTESGRIFVRNLPYSTSEEELSQLFGEYGPLTEVTLPLDKTTNKSTGMAFVTFMLPEHAGKAYGELDGQIFQGRLLHLLPARPRRGQEGGGTTPLSSSFKRKKQLQMKAEAGRGHNWNTLFLGANAVVDVMAEKYATEKGDILDASGHGGGSAAVRLALGETELVQETRQFLQQHGVNLEVFEQLKPERSKTVLVVKNLSAGTSAAELCKLFQPYGQLVQVIMPPAGISALVEFVEASHARQAFSKLAYTNFKHLPLYLEWAPVGVLKKSRKLPKESAVDKDSEHQDKQPSAKILVRNVPFEASRREVKELFSTFGTLKSVRLPKKSSVGSGEHRGFAFVEFLTKQDAKRAFESLSHSTHLYGRRLVLEWAEQEESLQAIRKRTAEHFHGLKIPASKRVSLPTHTDT